MAAGPTQVGTFRFVDASASAASVTLLSEQGKAANEVWTFEQWDSLCRHLHNMNDDTRFVMGFRGNDGSKEYVRSKNLALSTVVPWAWDSIKGQPKRKVAFVPYSQNAERKSRWGAFDFDAHDGGGERAKNFAIDAFRELLNVEDLFIILESSGSAGWHVFGITKEFRGVGDWVRLFKEVASRIGAPVEAGVCEIYPPEGAETLAYGKGVRAPGCWNPGSDSLSQLFWHNTEPLLMELAKEGGLPKKDFPERKKEICFSSPPSKVKGLYHVWYTQWRHSFCIRTRRTRNSNLTSLTGTIFHQVGYDMAYSIAEAQFAEKVAPTQARLERHMREFRSSWRGLKLKWLDSLSEEERGAYEALATDFERDAFRIVRSFHRKAFLDGAKDFPIGRDNLGERLGITGKGAAGIRDKFLKLEIIQRTKVYQANVTAARYKWIPYVGDLGIPNQPF